LIELALTRAHKQSTVCRAIRTITKSHKTKLPTPAGQTSLYFTYLT